MSIDTDYVADAAHQLENTLTTPDVSLIKSEAMRRHRFRQAGTGLGVVALACLLGVGLITLIDKDSTVEVATGQDTNEAVVSDLTQMESTRNPQDVAQVLMINPGQVVAGEDVVVSSTQGDLGGWFSFAIWDGSSWVPTVNALQVREYNGTPRTIPLGEEFVTESFDSAEPVTIVVPTESVEGTYQICALDRTDCATVEVRRHSEPGPPPFTERLQVVGETVPVPGGLVTVEHVDSDSRVGPVLSLETWTGATWEHVVGGLVSSELNDGPRTIPLGSDFFSPLPAFRSVTVQLPKTLEPGLYKLCVFDNPNCLTFDIEPGQAE